MVHPLSGFQPCVCLYASILKVSEVEKRKQRLQRQESKLQQRVQRVVQSDASERCVHAGGMHACVAMLRIQLHFGSAIRYRNPGSMSNLFSPGGAPSYMTQGSALIPTPRRKQPLSPITSEQSLDASARGSGAEGAATSRTLGGRAEELDVLSPRGDAVGHTTRRTSASSVASGAHVPLDAGLLSPRQGASPRLPQLRPALDTSLPSRVLPDDGPSLRRSATMAPAAARSHSLFPARTLGQLDHHTLQRRQARRPVVGGGEAELADVPPEQALTVADALSPSAKVGVPQRARFGHDHDAAFVNERSKHDQLVSKLLAQENAEIDLDIEAKRWAMATLREGWSTEESSEESDGGSSDQYSSTGSESSSTKRRRRRRRRQRRRRKKQENLAAASAPVVEGSGGATSGAADGASAGVAAPTAASNGEVDSGDDTGSDGGSDSHGSSSSDEGSTDSNGSTASTLSELTKAERSRLARSERISKMPEVVRDRVEWSQRALKLKITSAQLKKLQALWGSLCVRHCCRDVACRAECVLTFSCWGRRRVHPTVRQSLISQRLWLVKSTWVLCANRSWA